MVKTLTIPLTFSNSNQTTYNIQGGQLEKVKKITVRQISTVNNTGGAPVPVCGLYCDLVTPEQSLGSVILTPGIDTTVAPMCELEPQNQNVTGNHVFTLSLGPGTNYSWSNIETFILLTLSFE